MLTYRSGDIWNCSPADRTSGVACPRTNLLWPLRTARKATETVEPRE